MNSPTPKELKLIEEIKERISDLDVSEEYLESKNLVRFLRARNGNLNQSEEMIRKNVEFYERNESEDILRTKLDPDWTSSFPWSVVGFDEFGGPVIVVNAGRWDPASVAGNREDFTNFSIQSFESVWKIMRQKGKGKDFNPQFNVIVDLDGLGWRHYTTFDFVQGSLNALRIFEANYPDTLRTAVLINAPSIFGMFWKMIKPIMSEVTHAKIHFLGSDKKNWSRTLTQFFKKDQFPKKYGGDLQDNQKIALNQSGLYNYMCHNGNECCPV